MISCTLNHATVPNIIEMVEKKIAEYNGNQNLELLKQCKEYLEVARQILHRSLVAASANDHKRVKAIEARYQQINDLETKLEP